MTFFTFAALSFFSFLHSFAETPCTFSYKPESVKIEWTGYKFSEKKGVKGQFKDFKLHAPTSAASAEELFLATSVDIDPLKVDSGDPGRDHTLKEFLFKKLVRGPRIKGTVVTYAPTISKIKIEMNGQSKVVPFRMHIEGNQYRAETDIDLLDFKMTKPLASLNKACYELHKGSDGKSKTWSAVSLSLSAEVVNSCGDNL